MMRQVKVNIITGFLGAGKTTAIINLLQAKDKKENWAIIVNEFGEISIDSLTLSESTDSGRVYDIYGGCICCSAKEYFRENLERIIDEEKYDRIIIEPTGLGGSDMVSEIIESIPELQLLPSICLIDATSFENKRIQMIPLFRRQIQHADVLVLSKCDLIEDDQKLVSIQDRIQFEFPGKIAYLSSINGKLDVGLLNSGNPIQKDNLWGINLSKKEIKSKTYKISHDDIFDIDDLFNFFQKHDEIIRAKGYVKSIEGWHLVNYTLNNYKVDTSNEQVEGVITIFGEFEGDNCFSLIDTSIKELKFK